MKLEIQSRTGDLFGGWKNGIGNFIPGKAYKVKMNADANPFFSTKLYQVSLLLAFNPI